MVILESNNIIDFLIEHKLVGAHCTVLIDKHKLSADYVIVDDTCIYQFHEDKLKYIYFEQSDTLIFAFTVPKTIQFAGPGASIKFNVQPQMLMAEMICDKPYFTSVIKLDDNFSEKIDSLTGEFISLKPYAPVLKAIKSLKGLSSELYTSINVELGDEFWTVSVSQCCVFGAAKGLTGSITSQLFEKIYDFNAQIAQISRTSLLLRKDVGSGNFYLIHIPISREVELPNIIGRMVSKCKDVCTSQLTPDVRMIVGEIIKNVKKDTITVKLTEGRMDLNYVNNQVTLTTIPRSMDLPKGISIQVPVKSLISVVDILEEPTSILTNGEFICMMRDSKGLLISGIIS